MSRIKRGVTAKKRHKKIMKQAKGYYGARSRVYRVAKQAVIKSYQYSYRDRKLKKRYFRRLWITVINGFVRKYKINYSNFMHKIRQSDIFFNRKIIYEMIKNNNKDFNNFIENFIKSK